jgi:hypothetical protein
MYRVLYIEDVEYIMDRGYRRCKIKGDIVGRKK